jgi:O-antigen/teichoic acid export membrane protein
MSLKRNTLFNLSGSILPMVVSLVTVPLYLQLIGQERYGVLSIVWILLGCFAFFDAGLSPATAQCVARLSKSPQPERESAFWSAFFLTVFFGFVGALVLYALGDILLRRILDIPDQLRPEVLDTLPWIAAALTVSTSNGVVIGALEGQERFGFVNSIAVAGTFLFQIGPLLVAYIAGPDLHWLIPAAVLARMALVPIFFTTLVRTLPLTFRSGPSWRRARDLFAYAGWFSVSSIISPLLVSLDKFLAGSILGVASVPYYTVPDKLVRATSILPGSISRALFPRLAQSDANHSKELAERSVAYLVTLITPAIVVMILAMHILLRAWISPAFAEAAANVGVLLALSVWINGLAYIPSTLLRANGRPDLPAKFHIIEILPHALILWCGMHYYGLEGGAWAQLALSILDTALLFWGSRLYIMLLRLQSFWEALVWLALAIFIERNLPHDWSWLTLSAFSVCGLLVSMWALNRSQDLRNLLYNTFKLACRS